jgi:hypothetical protein
MAKQTFTTGQVLTAAQMTSLQQTAMLGGEASAKTANYTLVAADAGTAISMSNAGATTITVNTDLFAAGDTVQITNLGAGVCTITAGTATVDTSASLALAQYESGSLYFTSTSAAIFIKGAGAAAASGANYSLLNAGGTDLTGSTTITVSGISGKEKLMINVIDASSANASAGFSIRINGDTGTNYNYAGFYISANTNYAASQFQRHSGLDANSILVAQQSGSATGNNTISMSINGGTSAGGKGFQFFSGGATGGSSGQAEIGAAGIYLGSAAITSVSIISSDGNFDAGKIYVYGSAA